MPDSTAMRRLASVAFVALLTASLGAACGSAKATPGVPKANFKPAAELVLHPCGGVPPSVPENSSNCTTGLWISRPDQDLGPRVERVPEGSVLLIHNVDTHDRRVLGTVRGDQIFDTGIMHMGDSTTIVLSTPGTVGITETTANAHTSLVVTPKPGQKA